MATFPSSTSASDVWSLTDQYRAQAGINWPNTNQPQFVTGLVVNGAITVSYPISTLPGDLAIAVTHNFSPSAPSGFTSIFTTSGDAYGYAKNVSIRTVQAGDSTVYFGGAGGGFDSTLIIMRGRTSVSTTYDWKNAAVGSSTTVSVNVTGIGICIASDRGAAPAEPPIVSGAGMGVSIVGSAGYFYQVTRPTVFGSSHSANVTDGGGSYGSSALLIVAI